MLKPKKSGHSHVVLVCIIRDPRNARTDYWIEENRARQLYKEGKLLRDVTNDAYCTLTPSSPKMF